MSQQDTGLDPANGNDPSAAEPSNATGDAIEVRQKNAEEETAEAEAAAAERTRQILHQQIAAVDDAEEVCVFLVEDTLDAMFQEMQVSAENASVFARTSSWASDSVFAGVSMGATRASTSLDRSDSIEGAKFNGVMQQILKLDEDRYDDAIGPPQQSPGSRRASRSETKPEPSSSTLRFLRRLLAFIESSNDQIAREFMAFPAAQYVQRSVCARGKAHTAPNSTRAAGDWEIPSGSIGAFLTHVIDRCHVRVLPSTVDAVLEANATAIDAKVRAQATLSLSQITHFVRKAVLAAEHEGEAVTREIQQQQQADDTAVGWSQRTFQTEVAGRFKSRRPSDQDGARTSLQSCFMEEALPVASAIDRNVPGSIARKVPDASQRLKGADQKQMARRVIMAMMPGPKDSSRWLGLRTRVVHDSDLNIVQVAVDADVEVSIDSKSRVDGTSAVTMTKPTLSPKKSSVQFAAAAMVAASPVLAPRASKLVGRSFSGASNIKEERPVGSPITISTAEPDTAALSNIFSLGTPRQLTGDELARRNDILAQLEREETQQQRRLANASIAAMTFPPTACPSDAEERAFRAYVTANSSITTGVGFNFELPIASIANSNAVSPPPVAPRRPEKKNTNQSPNRRDQRASGARGGRSKFEVACDPPVFAVHDGNVHADVFKEASISCSPIRKASPSKYAGTPSPTAVLAAAPVGNGDLSPIRPVQSAGHLPQLDTSRLAAGVRAVVHGVEKRGPRQSPSRQSRLKLHNYNAGMDSEGGDCGNETYAAPSPPHHELQQHHYPRVSVPHSPVRLSTMLAVPSPPQPHAAPPSGSTLLPLIPPVSPIAAGGASPHRGKHVAFVYADGTASKKKKRTGNDEDIVPPSPSKSSEPRSAKRANQKQLVFDKKTVSPPRVRNRHFTGRSKKLRTDHTTDYEGDSDDGGVNDGEGARSTGNGGNTNIFAQPLEAPRRSLLPSHEY